MRRIVRFFERRLAKRLSLEGRFDRIYERRKWPGGGDETKSGAGSTLAATQSIRKSIPELLESIGAQALLDVGCGDYNWMKEVDLPCRYHGVDIVNSVIMANQERYGGPDVSFACLNAVSDPLPSGFDIVLCREVLFHLSFQDSMRMLRNIAACDARYLLTTTTPEISRNEDIVSGEFRNLNLLQPPFDFPPPEKIISDSTVSRGRALGLWKISDLDIK